MPVDWVPASLPMLSLVPGTGGGIRVFGAAREESLDTASPLSHRYPAQGGLAGRRRRG